MYFIFPRKEQLTQLSQAFWTTEFKGIVIIKEIECQGIKISLTLYLCGYNKTFIQRVFPLAKLKQWIYLAYKSFGRRYKAFESPSTAFGRTYKAFCERNDSLSGLLVKLTSEGISTAVQTVPRQLFIHHHCNCSLIPISTVHFLSCRSCKVWVKSYNTRVFDKKSEGVWYYKPHLPSYPHLYLVC